MIKGLVRCLGVSSEEVIRIGLKANRLEFNSPEVHEFLYAKRPVLSRIHESGMFRLHHNQPKPALHRVYGLENDPGAKTGEPPNDLSLRPGSCRILVKSLEKNEKDPSNKV